MPHEFPTSRLLVTLGWAKDGEEAVRSFLSPAGAGGERERRLGHALRRATRGVRLIVRELREVADRDEVLPREPVEIMSLVVQCSDAIVRELAAVSLERATQEELRELEDAVDELDDLVENQQIAADLPAALNEVSARVLEMYGPGTRSST